MSEREIKELFINFRKKSPITTTQVLLGLGFSLQKNFKFNYLKVFKNKEYYRLLTSFLLFGDGLYQSGVNSLSVMSNSVLESSLPQRDFIKLQLLGCMGIVALEILLLNNDTRLEFKVLGGLLDLSMKWVFFFQNSSKKVRILDQKLDLIFLVAVYTFSGSIIDGIKSFVNGAFISYVMDIRDSKTNHNVVQILYRGISSIYCKVKDFVSIEE